MHEDMLIDDDLPCSDMHIINNSRAEKLTTIVVERHVRHGKKQLDPLSLSHTVQMKSTTQRSVRRSPLLVLDVC